MARVRYFNVYELPNGRRVEGGMVATRQVADSLAAWCGWTGDGRIRVYCIRVAWK
jgi:hypothetical protein